MLASNIPSKVSVPFANSGTKNAIPVPSQIGVTPGLASYTDGFPPLTFTPLASGGVPPFGADFNGILNAVTQAVRWACAGGQYPYDAAFSTAVSGYPLGAIVQRADGTGEWLNLTDGNTSNPETGGAGWAPMDNYGITAVTGLTNANVTLSALQYGRNVITLAGTLTGNVQIIFPTTLQQWTVVNNCTGASVVTCKTSSGTGGTVSNSGGVQQFWGDGTNLNLGPGDSRYAPLTSSPVVGSIRNGKMSVTAANASATFTADEIVVESALGGSAYKLSSYSQVINLGTTGAGGMDTGTAPVSGFVAIYASCKAGGTVPGIFACNAATSSGSVYSGANLPTGVVATSLIGIWPTTAASLFAIGYQIDREVFLQPTPALSTSTVQGSYTSLSLASIVPPAAKSAVGFSASSTSNGSTTSSSVGIASSSGGLSGISITGTGFCSTPFKTPLITAQTIFYTMAVGGGTLTGNIYITGYTF